MAFATSSSAFGIKPPTSGNAFGQPSNPNTSPFGSFGTSSSQPPAQPSPFGGFGQAQNQNQPHVQNQPTSGGLFGQQSGTPQQTQQPQQSGLFSSTSWGVGSTNALNTATQPAQSAFGNWGQAGNQPQNQNQSQNQQQPSTGFGTGSSLFANTGAQQQPQLQLQLPQTQPQSGGLWGNTIAPAPSAGQSIFGQTASNQPAATQQQPTQQTPSFTRTTKFNDLPENIQRMFESIDTHIQGRIQVSSDLKARSLDEEPTKGAELIRKVHNDLVNIMSTLQADKAIVEELKLKVDQSVQDTIITTRIMDGFRNPQQNGAYLKNHVSFPLEFFTRAAEEIRHKLQWYKATVEQIERRLASAQNQTQYNPQAVTATLQAQNSTFLALASKTAELDTELQKIKSAYRELWRTHTGSARDPFNDMDRRPGDGGGLLNGLGSLNLSR